MTGVSGQQLTEQLHTVFASAKECGRPSGSGAGSGRGWVTHHRSHWPLTHTERSSGWRSEARHSVRWEKLAEEAFRQIFLGEMFNGPGFQHLPILRKSSKIINRDICSLWLAATFLTRCVPGYTSPLHQNHIYTDLPTTSMEQFHLRGSSVSRAIVLIQPQIIHNS